MCDDEHFSEERDTPIERDDPTLPELVRMCMDIGTEMGSKEEVMPHIVVRLSGGKVDEGDVEMIAVPGVPMQIVNALLVRLAQRGAPEMALINEAWVTRDNKASEEWRKRTALGQNPGVSGLPAHMRKEVIAIWYNAPRVSDGYACEIHRDEQNARSLGPWFLRMTAKDEMGGRGMRIYEQAQDPTGAANPNVYLKQKERESGELN